MFRVLLKIFFILLFLNSCGSSDITKNYLSISNTKINSYGYWTLFYEKNLICTASFPTFNTTSSYSLNRKLHYLMLVYDKKEKNYIITVVGGKNYKKLSELIIKINYNEYYLPTSKDRAWLTNKNLVECFINDMKKSTNFVIINSFDDETHVIDTYSLKGFNEIYELIPSYL